MNDAKNPQHTGASASRVELHIHTSHVSPCADCTGEQAVQFCIARGYDGMVITDHFSQDAASAKLGDLSQTSWEARVDHFLSGYRAAKAAAPEGFLVLLGMELRFPGGSNDYLVYGFDESFLYSNENLDQLGIQRFSRLAREQNLLLVQAHPFRWWMTVTPAKYLDGIEVYNGNSHHNSHNDFAALWARKMSLLPLSGSDYHGNDTAEGMAPGGIRLLEPVKNEQALVKMIKERKYTIL